MQEGLFPQITVVTPNFNQANFLEKTLRSVLDQNYPNLEYIVIDGGSTDGSLEIIQKYEDQLAYWASEKDDGMYHAINKGFRRSTGDIMCWINSDDVLWENSLYTVAEIFKNNPGLNWLQGTPSVIDEKDKVIFKRTPVSSKFYFYLYKHEHSFYFIQQESTFWSRELWEKSGGSLSNKYEVASDFDLWLRFFRFEKLYCTTKQLGAFRKRTGQKSENKELYIREAKASINENFRYLLYWEKSLLKILYFLERINRRRRWLLLKKIYHFLQRLIFEKSRVIK